MVLCMREKLRLFFKQNLASESKSDLQTVGLFAVLAVLTVIFVLLAKAVQFTPSLSNQTEIKPATSEAKISP